MKGSTLTFIISIIIIAAAVVAGILVGNRPSIYEDFAQCVADSDATFYGAFWCPHCLEQKSLFGRAADTLPYVECSLPDRSGQTQECTDAGIEGYPTWEFANGERYPGVLDLEQIEEITGCVLPTEHKREHTDDIQAESADETTPDAITNEEA